MEKKNKKKTNFNDQKKICSLSTNKTKIIVGGIITILLFSCLFYIKKIQPIYVATEYDDQVKITTNGKPLCIFLWSVNCSNCIESLQHILILKQYFEERGGKFMLILTDNHTVLIRRANALLVRLNAKDCINYFDKTEQCTKKYNIIGLPTLIVFDKNMRIYKRFEGFVPWAQNNNLQDVMDVFSS